MAYRKKFFIIATVFFFAGTAVASRSDDILHINDQTGWFGLEELSKQSVAFNPVTVSQNSASEELQCEIGIDKNLGEYGAEQSSGWLESFWGKPARNHLYLGMWTYHFEKGDGQDWNNQLLAVSYKGYYGGTFINTHCDRVWSLGVQRTWYQQQYGLLGVELGYRLGMMYGYTKYLTLFDTRFFPLFQVVADVDYKNIGIEFSWAGVVATVGFLFRF